MKKDEKKPKDVEPTAKKAKEKEEQKYEIADTLEDWVPKYLQEAKKPQKRMMVMCKYYAYKYPCLFEKKFGKCNSVHSSKVVEAHDYPE